MQGAIEFLEAKGLLKKNANTPIPTELPIKHDIYEYFNVPDRLASRILGAENPTKQAAESSRQGYYQEIEEKRGLKGKIGWRELKRMEEIVNDRNIRYRALPWAELAKKAGLTGDKQVYFYTVRKLMQDQEYYKCIACIKNWLSSNIRIERRVFTRDKQTYKLEDWKRVRWSDEIYFGFSPEGKLRIIRYPGERFCWDYIQERGKPLEEKDKKRLYAWATVGWNFKTSLIWYIIPLNQNGKIL